MRLFDGRGLYLEIAPTGSRWWRFKYRFAGKEKRISLGVYPDVGLKKARDRRDEMRKFVADGIDPSAARKQEKLMALDAALNTFEAVAREWFEKHSPNWEASYSVKLLARLEANVFPWLGHRPIRDIKAPELLSVLRRVESRGVLETAHRLMNYCGNIYRYAVATGRAERDIFRGRYRKSFQHPAPIPAGKVQEYKFRLPTVNYVFKPGHRIMVQIQSTLFPLYDRNPQTFVPNIFFAKPTAPRQGPTRADLG